MKQLSSVKPPDTAGSAPAALGALPRRPKAVGEQLQNGVDNAARRTA